jgi:methyl-accepting chemotaxis protein
MKEIEDDFIDLHIDTAVKKSCFMRIVALLWLPLLIFLGVVASYLGYITFKVEFHSVLMIGVIFIIYLFFIKHNAYYASCKFNKRHEEMALALKWYIQNNRLTIGETTKSNAPFDSFMQDFSASLRNDNFASVAAGLFPTLGILGTFISIAISMPDFASQNASELEREISELLGGVGTAFYVSIYGIFLSLWWIFYEKSGMSRFEKNIHNIKENLRHYFWSRAEIEQIHFAKSLENFEKLNEIFTKISSNEFIDNIQHTLQQRLDMFDNIIHHEQNALQQSTAHFNAIIKETDMTLQRSETLAHAYENISHAMKQVSTRLEDGNNMLRQAVEKIAYKEDKLQMTQERLEQSIRALNQSLQGLSAENVKELYTAVVQNLEIMRSESAKIGYAFNSHLEDFDEKYTQKLKNSLELIDSESAKIIQQIAELRLIDKR